MSELFDWLVDGCPDAHSAPAIVEQLGVRLRAEGVSVDRIGVFVLTLHPDIAGRGFTWTPGREVAVGEMTFDMMHSPLFQQSPPGTVIREQRELRRRIADEDARDFPVLHELGAAGYTDYLILPLRFTTGDAHAIAFSTKRASGFSDDDVGMLRRIVRPLARVTEIYALRRTSANLLSTYVGRNAGDRVLAGKIRRGDIEVIPAIIWFSDLRGFTQLSQRVSAREVIDAINQAFDAQVAAVHGAGGEVLKFIGDGMLAIFPVDGDLGERARGVLAAGQAAQRTFAAARPDLAFGLALHVGDVAYGNIGGMGRLDFTAIGPAVNLAARLESLTGKVGRPLVVSRDIAAHLGDRVEPIGAHELKGIAGAVDVYAPRA
ncbi:MAG: adenylate/guanylate cyclase domain-containing protein [Deltaproteobacteria bacterium]|nr:adenylate/guanylate cyclase domain-containing protein [Deltaproteobacteria bacterium]